LQVSVEVIVSNVPGCIACDICVLIGHGLIDYLEVVALFCFSHCFVVR
jgi:hypothetical protein